MDEVNNDGLSMQVEGNASSTRRSTSLKKSKKIKTLRKLIRSKKFWLAATLSALTILLLAIIAAFFIAISSSLSFDSDSGHIENPTQNQNLSEEVLKHKVAVEFQAGKLGAGDLVPYILAIMMVESGGKGTDVMQCGESAGLGPGGMPSVESSIIQGIKVFKESYDAAVAQGMNWEVAVAAYNYGGNYVNYAAKNGGKHSIAISEAYSRDVVAPALGNTTGETYSYVNAVSQAAGKTYLYRNGGNYLYAELVKQYLVMDGTSTGTGSGGKGNGKLISIAEKEIGNAGGQKFWSYMGFGGRVEWCACFVSWVCDQAGLIQSQAAPKTASCAVGVAFFKEKNKWQPRGSYIPKTGDIIYFDWGGGGTGGDHVGIVEKADKFSVYTIEGNNGDAVRRVNYPLGSASISGYGQTK